MPPDGATPEPLYLPDNAIRQRLGIGESRWYKLLPDLEAKGLPRRSSLTGMRFWPAVRRFFYVYEGLDATMPSSVTADEEDFWNVG